MRRESNSPSNLRRFIKPCCYYPLTRPPSCYVPQRSARYVHYTFPSFLEPSRSGIKVVMRSRGSTAKLPRLSVLIRLHKGEPGQDHLRVPLPFRSWHTRPDLVRSRRYQQSKVRVYPRTIRRCKLRSRATWTHSTLLVDDRSYLCEFRFKLDDCCFEPGDFVMKAA